VVFRQSIRCCYNSARGSGLGGSAPLTQYSLVFCWRRNDMAESSSLRIGAGSAFHVDGPATAKSHGP